MIRILTLTSIGLLLSSSSALAAADPLKARAETNWRYGYERSILMTEFWVPLAQSEKNVLYGDLRLMGDDQENREGNIGIGYRSQQDELNAVIGGHAWIDRRITERGSKFHQVTVGAEWLGKNFDVLANGYIPLSSEKTYSIPNADPQGPALAGTGILVDTNGTLVEEPQHGLDLEFGWQVPFLQNNTDSFRAYAGGYYFDGDNSESVSGWRTRVATDITPDIQIGARFQKDDERGSQGFLEATVRFPFGQKQSFREQGLRARLDESPERDIDIVTGSTVTDSGDRVAVINQATGEEQVVLHVDNTAAGGGDGSVENPFNTLADAQAAATEHSIIYLNRGDGSNTNQDQGLLLNKTGQQIIGSGANFMYDSGRFTTANGAAPSAVLIRAAGAAPIISNANPNSDGVTVTANDVRVAGISVDGATRDGIVVTNIQNLSIEETNMTGNVGRGLYIQSTGANDVSVKLTNTVISGNAGDGIEFSDAAGGGTLIADLGGGSLGSSGGNNIFGNLGNEINADLDGGNLSATNNFWGGGALTDTAGPDAGNIDASGAGGAQTCSSCTIVLSAAFTDLTSVQENLLNSSNALTLSGFDGTRYISISGDGSPELIINGTPTGMTTAAVQAGDTLAIRLRSSTTGLTTQTAALDAASTTENFAVQTRFLPNAISNLGYWFDATDVDGDFDYTDTPVNGTEIATWFDKSTNGNHAVNGNAAERAEYTNAGVSSVPALEFEIGDGFVIGGSASLASNNYSYFVVLTPQPGNNTQPRHILSNGSKLIQFFGASTALWTYQYMDGSVFGANNHNTFPFDSAPHIVSGVSNYNTGTTDYTRSIYFDGTFKQTVNNTGKTLNAQTAGMATNIGETNFSGDITEIIYFTTDISAADRQAIESYLGTKYSITVP